ncbi:glycerol kinase GlpK [Nitrosococcus wardiae]|uniref:Glycerol kinase n=1 Tax=Nitrosococcus wardiae TaxID=1814290 RepID=A0A4P7C1R2_9GAMM|nr:glycerol kinase GlpK [Nitrosococcus wardiae]QBQ55587.1 glycerol kinase GlpK [Nitrosococcus wardiae]
MATSHVLSIDAGTTGITILIFDQQGRIQGRAYSEFTQHYPRPGWVEHDPNEIWSVTQKVVAAALQEAHLEPANLAAIGITNQRETVVMWDRSTGEPVAKAIVWQDRRTTPLCEKLKARGLEETFRHRTGLVIDPYFSGTKVKWLLDHVDGLRQRAEGGEIAFGTIDSWLVWKLTGGKNHITDYSNASRTLLYNIHDLQWDEEILQLLHIPPALLPQVKPSSYVYGETIPQALLGTGGIPIAGIAGDQQAALFGQACYGKGLAKNTYGTGSFVLMNTGKEAILSQEKLLTTIAWGIGDEPVEYALEGAIFITGAGIQWLRDGLGIINHASETEDLARSVETNEGVYFVPALVGLGAPHWDPYARGTLLGITRGTTKAHLVRAVLESMGYQTRDVVKAMERDSAIPLKVLRCDGGASINRFLMQFQADILGVAVEVPKITETTALGAAYLAGLATGFWQSRKELDSQWQLAHRYEPTLSETERMGLYHQWQRAVERAKGWAQEKE